MKKGSLLEQSLPFDIVVESEGDPAHPDSITIATKYAVFTSRMQKSAAGKPERWNQLVTRPAFEVAMLQKREGEIFVFLMQKRRKAEDEPRTKVPGGYLWGPLDTYGPEKVLADTGLLFDASRCRHFPGVIGHSEIITPIQLLYTFHWEQRDKPREGVEIFQYRLDDSIEMAANKRIENDSSLSLLMWLWYHHTNNLL